MKNIVLVLSLFLGSCIYSMDQESFVSSSSSSSSCSADLETLTFEQMQKDEEESKELQDESLQVASTEVDHEHDWYCEVRFPRTNNELSWLNTAKSLVGAELANYDNIQVCDLGNGKLGVLYAVRNRFYTIRILDTNSGKCLHNINPLQDEKSSKLLPTQLCRLPENRAACILNSLWGENKKIKIYDINFGKLLKDIIVEGEYAGSKLDRIQGVYLSENRIALLNQAFEKACRFILILDLNSEKIVKKIDLVKKSEPLKYTNVFGIVTWMDKGIRVFQAEAFSDGRLLLECGKQVCIIDTITDEVDIIAVCKQKWHIDNISMLPNGQWLSLDSNGMFEIWDNEKFKFKKIQEILNNKLIPDLQNTVLDYLSKDWTFATIIGKLDYDQMNRYILDENHILLSYKSDWSTMLFVLNVKTETLKNIVLKREFVLKMHSTNRVKILDQGKKIAFYAQDGSIEIWTNQPKKEFQDGCIIS